MSILGAEQHQCHTSRAKIYVTLLKCVCRRNCCVTGTAPMRCASAHCGALLLSLAGPGACVPGRALMSYVVCLVLSHICRALSRCIYRCIKYLIYLYMYQIVHTFIIVLNSIYWSFSIWEELLFLLMYVKMRHGYNNADKLYHYNNSVS